MLPYTPSQPQAPSCPGYNQHHPSTAGSPAAVHTPGQRQAHRLQPYTSTAVLMPYIHRPSQPQAPRLQSHPSTAPPPHPCPALGWKDGPCSPSSGLTWPHHYYTSGRGGERVQGRLREAWRMRKQGPWALFLHPLPQASSPAGWPIRGVSTGQGDERWMALPLPCTDYCTT